MALVQAPVRKRRGFEEYPMPPDDFEKCLWGILLNRFSGNHRTPLHVMEALECPEEYGNVFPIRAEFMRFAFKGLVQMGFVAPSESQRLNKKLLAVMVQRKGEEELL
jgi:hypothetical protein